MVLVMEAAVVLVVVVVTIAEGGLLTGGVTMGPAFATDLEDGSWSRLSNTTVLRCWAFCGGTWFAMDTGTDVIVVVTGTEVAVGVISAGVVVIVSVVVE
jgi:hypothetical protein